MAGSVISRIIFIGYCAASFILALIYSNLISRQNTFKSHPLIFVTVNTAMVLEVTAVLVFFIKPGLPAFEIPAILLLLVLLSVLGGYYFLVIRPVPNDDIMQYSDNLVLLADDSGRVLYANNKACEALEKELSALVMKPLSSVLPDATRSPGNDGAELEINGKLYSVKIRNELRKNQQVKILFLSDQTRTVEARNRMQKIETELGQRVRERTEELEKSNAILLREIDEHKLLEQKLQSSLEEKNLLLNEVHHRVKNNLQVIISLLTLQKKYIHDDHTLDIFQTAIYRIRSMAMIHERLYKSDNLSNADFSKYLNDLVRHLVLSYKTRDDAVHYSVDVHDVYLDVDTSITCGLIINELIVNILKHAFPDKQKDCKIEIRFVSVERGGDNEFGTGFGYRLEIRDNGKGMPAAFNPETNESYGYKIIRTLVTQLRGAMTVRNDGGTVVSIEF
ncbi:MAG: hypothetical protein JW874_07630 [Spirochaetales bacterium]|nr:hypothetical protein [Spirochaetales bacterium]